ncbi:hybrid sensor histidine kinase/response regulator [Sneathiella glossodoripedis]|uniref:hybrid sensor histidine kinase/response regulator n=1 Tax=Sneathiella glossodoripedis TaxID=418853 RepID=UPI00227731DF|nr:PAS domain-containing sensor histidine kinase [Sneathiella glossodoripedis]
MTNLQTDKIILENKSLIDLFQPPGGTLIGLEPTILWEVPENRQEILTQLDEKKSYALSDVSLKKFNGETFPAKIYGRYLERDGVPYSVFWIIDQSEEKAAQKKIIESENSLRDMLAASPVALGISDIKTGKISFVNESLSNLLKMPAEDLLGDTTFQFWRKAEDRVAFVEEFKRTGRVKPKEMQIQRHNGEPVWVLISWTTIIIENEPKIVFWLNDISQIKEAEEVLKASHETLEQHVAQRTEELRSEIEERRKIEDALRKSEEQFEAFASSASDWFWATDENHIFNHVSDRFEEMTGLSADDFMGKSRMEVLEKYADEEVWREHHDIILNHKPFREFTYAATRNDGSVLYASISGMPIFDNNGEFKGYRGAGRDITHQIIADEQAHQMEEQLRQSQKMEALGQLTGGIAHDFNNILAVILGNVELAREKIEKDLQLESHLKIVEASAIKGATLTQRLLAYSRKQSLRPVAVNLNELVSGILTLVDRLLGETIVIETEFNDETPPVFADANQLENALMNLCINSRDAMPNGGILRISTGMLDLNTNRELYPDLSPGCYSWLEVTDTGKGMDPQTLAHVFEPFFTTKEVGKGTGLGLSMVYGFAHQSNGTVDIDSKSGDGTRARIVLPSYTSE